MIAGWDDMECFRVFDFVNTLRPVFQSLKKAVPTKPGLLNIL